MWQKGPLPPDTWMWGGVTPKGTTGGFWFADFCGDHVKTVPEGKILKADEIEWWNNCLDLPPQTKGGSRLG